MIKVQGDIWIKNLRRKWIILIFLKVLVWSLGISLLLTAVFINLFSWSLWTFAPIFIIVSASIAMVHPFWKISLKEVSSYLDFKYPELEESSALLLKPVSRMSSLEKLQKQRVYERLPELLAPANALRKLGFGSLFFVLAILMLFLAPKLTSFNQLKSSSTKIKGFEKVKKEEHLPPQISAVSVEITPPQYTGQSIRIQSKLLLKAEAGASVKWKIQTSARVNVLKFIFNDKETLTAKPVNASKTEWTLTKTLTHAGFYQLVIDDKKSDLFQVEIIPDLPVRLKITSPKQHSLIDFGRPPFVNLRVSLNDDYGIKDAFISVTMASGKGEGVSFTEKKLLFNTVFNNQRKMDFQKVLALKALGMKPGDELYFFIKALDNHGQSSRSDVYFVSMVDTAELMSMVGMANGVNLVPEYFRSQRQLIIDTEKLLKEKSNITEEVFKKRSNDLGIDQKLLRLRYGKFLGEESENEIGGDHDHEESEEKFGDTKSIMDRYAHNHDVAEDATFFEPDLKAQLKAVLTEMWNAELYLRTYKPEVALPFEYKALRLLKDLQQKSRAYVAKTTVKTSQLKEEKRLSGELDKIMSPQQKNTYVENSEREVLLKKALSLLEDRKGGHRFNEDDLQLLHAIEREMIIVASDHPVSFLPALKELRKVTTAKQVMEKDIDRVEKAIYKMMVKEEVKPQLPMAAPASDLYKSYFNHLKKERP